jgi:alpha-tubulin suppressor-like RCC1 family protein
MKRFSPTRQILVFTVLTLSLLTLGLRAASVTIAPANPSVLIGQTLQLAANGAVVPISISTGLWHTCVLYSDQSVRCTGINNQGEIGNGTTTGTLDPVVAIGTVNAVTLRNGNEHTCTLVGDGRMQCWGTNYTGQLGDGTMGGFAVVPQFVHNITNAIKAISGGYFTCAILPDHTVQCWGRNQDGQLGNGDATTDMPLPGAVQNLGPVADLAAGGYHNCALMPDHTVECWGRNGRGQVGDGTSNSPITLPHQVVGMNSAAALSLGGYHSCALLQNATVQCWGQSDVGQIGAPGLAFSSVPVTVNGIASATAVYTGYLHSCALLSDGTLWCWGHNDFGQLGNGTTSDSASPVQVQGIVNPLAVAGGIGHTCALMPDSSVQCWGENNYGELGNGTGVNSVAPVTMHFTGMTWTSSNPGVATISASGLVTGVGNGTSTITATDSLGNSGSTTVTVAQMQTLAVIPQGDGGGTVTSSPAGIACGQTCTGSFTGGSQVTLTGVANTDSTFTGWTGCDSVSGATCTVAMNNTRSVTAIFMLKRFTLSVATSGAGHGAVTSNPSGINCGTACSSDYPIGTAITLTAAPAADSIFSGWTGCDSTSGATCTLTMGNPRSVTAAFALKTFTLSVGKSGVGSGTVTSDLSGINCGTACSSDYVINTSVTLTASPAANSVFLGWTGCDSASSTTCTVLMSAAKSVTANFDLKRFTLTVAVIRELLGNGTVTSSPAGISCGSDCSETYVIGTVVTLTAQPSGISLFDKWKGCDVSNGTSCTVTMNAAKSVTASFIGLSLF